MDQDDLRLSRIETLWSIVRQAHDRDGDAARQAQQRLFDRYSGAVRRYLLGALRDADAADEVFQEFSLKLVSGAFLRADADHGRFRQFLKTSLFHLIVDYQRRQRRRGTERPLVEEPGQWVEADGEQARQDAAWVRSWREELLAKSWAALEETQRTTSAPYYAVLRFRLEHPDLRSPQIAEQLGAQLGRALNASAIRVLTHRAREIFAAHLLDCVLDSLDQATLDAAEQELIELGLLDYCRPALVQRRAATPDRPPA